MEELLDSIGCWRIVRAKDGHVFVYSDTASKPTHEDHPILVNYPDKSREVLFDFPERIPKRVKAAVRRILLSD